MNSNRGEEFFCNKTVNKLLITKSLLSTNCLRKALQVDTINSDVL